ncbi:MAG: Protein nirH, partial [Pseudomonadota bacterium]
MSKVYEIDAVDRALIKATQGGLPLVARPYDEIGAMLSLSGAEVQARLQHL